MCDLAPRAPLLRAAVLFFGMSAQRGICADLIKQCGTCGWVGGTVRCHALQPAPCVCGQGLVQWLLGHADKAYLSRVTCTRAKISLHCTKPLARVDATGCGAAVAGPRSRRAALLHVGFSKPLPLQLWPQGLVRRLLDRADGVSRRALRDAVFYVVRPGACVTMMRDSDRAAAFAVPGCSSALEHAMSVKCLCDMNAIFWRTGVCLLHPQHAWSLRIPRFAPPF